MTHLPVPSTKKESGVIRHIAIESDGEKSDTDNFEVIRQCICFLFVKIIIFFDFAELIYEQNKKFRG